MSVQEMLVVYATKTLVHLKVELLATLPRMAMRTLFILLPIFFFTVFSFNDADVNAYGAESTVTLTKSGPNAPEVVVLRDDRVATLELDYVAGNPWTPFDIGEDGLGAVGYRVKWISLRRDLGQSFKTKVTSLRRTQIQPLFNNEPYFVRVDYVNRLGELVGDFSYGLFNGGSDVRVKNLRKQMSGFFDDFNRPAGLPDELNWNTTFSQTNDPEMQAFFINSQFHTHTVVGTPRMDLFGDRGQTTHRIRNQLRLNEGETRRIVFDIDGVNFAGRAIWYLDLIREESEMTSHVTVGGGAGSAGHPAPGIRFGLDRQKIDVFRFNERGEQILLQENRNLDFGGVQMLPNVRRSVEILLSQENVSLSIDGVVVLDTPIDAGALEEGDYTVHWTGFGYNTMKVAMPYFLIHWDNFGFDGPASSSVVHNYRTQVSGSDLVRSDDFETQTVTINIPDDLTPTDTNVVGEARLVFVRQMNNWDAAEWTSADSVTVGGLNFAIPEPVSSATPSLALNQLINTNAAYSTYIPLGTVGVNGTAPLIQGLNQVSFRGSRCCYHNVHIEVKYPRGTEPTFTPPQDIHEIVLHPDLMKVGLPARIASIADQNVDPNPWYSNLKENFNRPVSGSVNIVALVNGDDFTSERTLSSDFTSSSLAAAGENPGIAKVQLWIRPDDGDETTAVLIEEVATNADVATPQFTHRFELSTSNFANGTYELFLVAEDSRGIKSLPGYGGVGEQVNEASELNGMYYPLHITINN